jgi:hypothetical protein
VEFNQTTVPQLYTAADTGAAPPNRLLYLLPQGTQSPPPTLSFADAWTAGGAYLFLAAPPADGTLPRFAAQAWAFLGDRRLVGTRFAWLEAPDATGLLRGDAVQVTDLGNGPVVAVAASIGLRNVTLDLPRGAPVTVDATAFELAFGGASLAADWGRVIAGSIGAPVRLGLTGPLQGCLRFGLELAQTDLDALDVGLRWFYAEPPDPEDPLAPAPAFFLSSLRFPLFDAGVTVFPSLDPLAPLDPARTFFAFSAADAGLTGGTAQALPSHLRSTLDDQLSLTPLTGTAAPTHFAALVFAADQQAGATSGRDPLYLTPLGDFALGSSRSGAYDVMGGLSGVEYFELPTGTGVASWFPGGPAFAAGFHPGQPSGYTTLAPDTMPTTAYAAIAADGAAVDYFAQPDQSILYNYGTGSIAGVQTITPLAAVPVHAATLQWPPGSSATFPLLAFAGLRGDALGGYAQLESQVVNPARRARLGKAPAQPRPVLQAAASQTTPPSPDSTTPQGLLASYVPGGSTTQWDKIVLGKMAVTQGELKLTNVSGDLLSAFQSNKLFLVASDLAGIQAFLAKDDAQITIGSDKDELWHFDLDPSQWASYGTVLILKFYDMAIEQLAAQPSVWAFADEFNASPAAIAGQIGDTITKAQKLAPADSDYAAFVAAVTDPNWNGILALSVRSPLASLPSELEGIAVGIDPALFKAHHVGIDVSKITVPAAGSGQAISISDSSIFGLIDYKAPSPLPPHAGDWAFQVDSLKVLFANSAVAGFSSVIDLQVNTLFGEPATLEGGGSNVVPLYGVYQKHEVNGQVVESYTFETHTDKSGAVFDMTSQVLNAVVIQKAQFVTVTSKSTANFVESQFLFWGLLDFKALTSADGKVAFDVFSFGRGDDGTPAGLAFSNLILDMTFDPAATPEVPTFAFDASALAFDLASSTPRPDSVFQHFPVTVARLTQAKQGATPTGLGYMGVQTPLSQSTLTYPWYSLDYDLNLGTPGALAAEAGFVATLTAAWSPATGADLRVFTGLKLPGSSGAKRSIPIEGLFDITFKTLEIVVPAKDTFVLVLYGIGFKFLSFTFPPSGQVNFALFGDPTNKGNGDTSLGWYAAYAKPESQGGNGKKQLTGAP